MSEKSLDFEKLREKLAGMSKGRFWKGLEELGETEEFKQFLAHEYPHGAADFENALSRRDFLKWMGASLIMAGLAGCKPQPLEKIVPYRQMPEEIIPGKPLFFATGMTWNGHTTGILVESHMGRPVKIEGNPEHPDSLGAALAIHQASLLGLYDPDRSKAVLKNGQVSTWSSFTAALETALQEQQTKEGAGLRILTPAVLSPALARQLEETLKKFPQARWHVHEALPQDHARKAQRLAFGAYVDPVYDFEKADVVVSFDCDFITNLPGSIRYSRQFAARRSAPGAGVQMNRLYQIETAPSLAGAMADHRLPASGAQIQALIRHLAQKLGVRVSGSTAELPREQREWIEAAARDLTKHKGASLILAGAQQPAAVQMLAHALNQALGNAGKTVRYIDPVEMRPGEHRESFKELNESMRAGRVDLLILLGVNPVYDAPADFDFAANLGRVRETVQLSLYRDETSRFVKWHLPQLHELESFSDGRASDGTVTLIQPLIAALYGGRSPLELTGLLLGRSGRTDYEILRDYWKDKIGGLDFEKAWRRAVHDGLVQGSAFPAKPVKAAASPDAFAEDPRPKHAGADDLEIHFAADPAVWDGRFANNGWLQELPKPLTQLTWDNPAWISAALAEKHGLSNGDEIEIRSRGRSLRLPVWIMPGQAAGSITLFLGYGRKFKGRVATGRGFNTYRLRTAGADSFAAGEIHKTGRRHKLAATQHHHSMEGRALIRTATAEEFRKHPDFAHHAEHGDGPLPSLYPGFKYEDHAWGMAINLNACTGCNACVTACQSENNIPVVGKDQVAMGREMHWIRVDQYHEGGLENPAIHHQPVMCMHCENAPCEPVCPVGATMHSDEGLNEMIYNRCVGTRYCSNNCPYKVRRFNFLEYNDRNTESLKFMRNPDVTVRSRGVMEKCTFCVQRINQAHIQADKEGREMRDGEIVTACQSACPTKAITFGDINDPQSLVARLKQSPLNYGLLTELNTRPRVSYLAKVTNPNPELMKPGVTHGA